MRKAIWKKQNDVVDIENTFKRTYVLILCIHFENKGQMNIQQNILHKNINYVIKISDFITFHHYQILPDKKTHI